MPRVADEPGGPRAAALRGRADQDGRARAASRGAGRTSRCATSSSRGRSTSRRARSRTRSSGASSRSTPRAAWATESLDIDDAAGGARDLAAGGRLLQLAERPRGPAAARTSSATAGCAAAVAAHAPATGCRPRPSGSGSPATRTAAGRSSTRGARRCRCRPARATTRTRAPAGSSTQVLEGYDDGYKATAPGGQLRRERARLLPPGRQRGGVGARPLLAHAVASRASSCATRSARPRASTM